MKKNILIAGSGGAIGGEFTKIYNQDKNVKKIIALSRSGISLDKKKIYSVKFNYINEEPDDFLISAIGGDNIDVIIVATGMLYDDKTKPEKSLADLNNDGLSRLFKINVFGPMLLIKKILRETKKTHPIKIIFLTARLGSIADNKIGGWYSYRSSKAALNMMIKTLSIEMTRSNKKNIVIGVHPGTVKSNLSAPFVKHVAHTVMSPNESVKLMVRLFNRLSPEDSGKIFDFSGNIIDP